MRPRHSTFLLSSLQLSLAVFLLHAAATLRPQTTTLSFYHPLGPAACCNGKVTHLYRSLLGLAFLLPIGQPPTTGALHHHPFTATHPRFASPPQVVQTVSALAR